MKREQLTYQRICYIFEHDYNLTLENISGYKGTRYGQTNKYRLVNKETKEIILFKCTLEALSNFLISKGYEANKKLQNEKEKRENL